MKNLLIILTLLIIIKFIQNDVINIDSSINRSTQPIKGNTIITKNYLQLSDNTNSTNCDRSQLAALLLSIFLGRFGVDDFYLGHMSLGAGKLVLTVLPIILLIIVIIITIILYGTSFIHPLIGEFCESCDLGMISKITMILQNCCASVFFIMYLVLFVLAVIGQQIWWIIDIVFIATGELGPAPPHCYSSRI